MTQLSQLTLSELTESQMETGAKWRILKTKQSLIWLKEWVISEDRETNTECRRSAKISWKEIKTFSAFQLAELETRVVAAETRAEKSENEVSHSQDQTTIVSLRKNN